MCVHSCLSTCVNDKGQTQVLVFVISQGSVYEQKLWHENI